MVSFESGKTLNTKFKEQNDPVMGGGSSGNFTAMEGFGLFEGTVRNVSFLHAPGFCNAQVRTGEGASALDLSGFVTETGGVRLIVSAVGLEAAQYVGHKLALSAFGVPHHNGGHEREGSYKQKFAVGLSFWKNRPLCESVYLPMSGFSSDWSDFTGDCSTKDPNGYQHKCCPSGGLDSDPVCPAKKTLAKVDGITIWSEGVGGNFALKIYEIAAVADATKKGGPMKCPW